jgi:hypothetical protein
MTTIFPFFKYFFKKNALVLNFFVFLQPHSEME